MRHLLTLLFATLLLFPLSRAADLASYKAKYESGLGEIMLGQGAKDRGEKVEGFNKEYLRAVENLKRKVQATGDLDRTNLVVKELERFDEEKTVPGTGANVLPEIARIRTAYHQELAKLEVQKNHQIAGLTRQYLAALERLQQELVKADDLDAAMDIRAETLRVEAMTKDLATAPATPHAKPGAAPRLAVDDSLVVYLPFRRMSPLTRLQNESSSRIPASASGARWVKTGAQDGALLFDGEGRITIPPDPQLECGPEGLTIAFWIKLKDAPSDIKKQVRWFSKGGWSNKRGYFCKSEPHEKDLRVFTAEGLLVCCRKWYGMPANEWFHIAVSLHADKTVIYFNGNQETLRETKGGVISPAPKDPLTLLLNLPGMADEVRIYKRFLSAEEIKTLYDQFQPQ